MTDKVADASAVVALLFGELTRDQVLPRLRGADLFDELSISWEAVDLGEAIALAELTRLSLYDAQLPLARPGARRRPGCAGRQARPRRSGVAPRG